MSAPHASKIQDTFQWKHSETIGLANFTCARCEGGGLTPGVDKQGNNPCVCVLRNIFRACLKRFYFCADNEPYRCKVVLVPSEGHDANCSWTRTSENYMADFYLVAKRTLSEAEFRIFKFHFLLGAEWSLCCRRLNMDRGTFFHAVYRIEQKLGREYRELRPYPLYPPDEYFGGTVRKAKVLPFSEANEAKNILRPMLRSRGVRDE